MPAPVGQRLSRSLVYGLDMLKLFSAEHPVLGVAELAELMDVSRPTAHRYASTFLDLGYLERAPKRRYRLTHKSAQLGLAMLGSLQLVRRAAPIMRRLRDSTGRAVGLAILDGPEVLYLQRFRGFEPGYWELERGLGPGSRQPARQTAAGQALLAAAAAADTPTYARVHASVPGLAVTIPCEAGERCALEIAVPGGQMSSEQMIASLSDQLCAAAASICTAESAPQQAMAVPEPVPSARRGAATTPAPTASASR